MNGTVDMLLHSGITVTFAPKLHGDDPSVEARLTDKYGQCSLGYGSTAESATINALVKMVSDLGRYLEQSERRADLILLTLHGHGFMYNALDEKELVQFNKVKCYVIDDSEGIKNEQ